MHIMAFQLCSWLTVFAGLILISTNLPEISAAPQVPCYFIFGDSLADSGNNNNLNTSAKVNYPPYGIDFPGGPTGRFTNGETVADVVGKHLGFDDYIPPFATARGPEIIKGVNYASGSAGIRDETGSQLGENICFNKQLQNHGTIVSEVASILGNQTSAKEHLGKCLYNVVIGSNDYINNYLLPTIYNTSKLYTPDQYAAALIEQYSQHLKTLFNYGARKIAVFGLGPIGCAPAEVSSHNGTALTCVNSINAAVKLFNDGLQSLVDELNGNLTNAQFIYLDGYTVPDPVTIGLRILNQPCCKVNSETGLCTSGQKPCLLRDLFLFWDAFHPSEVMNKFVGKRSYDAIRSGILSDSQSRHCQAGKESISSVTDVLLKIVQYTNEDKDNVAILNRLSS